MRVLVADDHSLFRDGIASLLEAAGFDIVGQVGDGQEAVEAATRLRPDLVLLDISMPVMDGPNALRKIKAALPETNVVMLTVSDEDKLLFESIRAGADGYLLKSLTADQFVELLQGLDRGEAALTRKMTKRLLNGISAARDRQHKDVHGLSSREVELLRLVARGFSNKAIAQELSVSENTVKYHMKNILQKLNAKNRTEAVTTAMQAGLLDSDTSKGSPEKPPSRGLPSS